MSNFLVDSWRLLGSSLNTRTLGRECLGEM